MREDDDRIARPRALLDAALRRLCVGASDRPIVAYSGGPDSAALLALLATWRDRLEVTAVHVDHGLRSTSAAEAEAAAALAASLGFTCRIVRVRLEGKGGPEARARRARYRALADLAEGRPILTAHTADDQAETVLLRLARGAGAGGLAGIRPAARIEGAEVRRPLLGVRREALRAVLRARGIEPVIDPSNEDPAFARNRLRAAVLPALEAALPGAIPALARAAELLAADEVYLRHRAHRALRRLGGAESVTGVDPAGLLALPEALRGRVVRALASAAGGPVPTRVEVDRILAIAARGGDVHLRGGLRARSHRGRLAIAVAPTGRAARRESPPFEKALLTPDAPVEVGGCRLEVRFGAASASRDRSRFELSATVAPPFVVRTVRPGDRVPVPDVGNRKVRDLLREAGMPAEERASAVLLLAGGAPVWLVGVRPLGPRPAPGEAAWVFSAATRHPPGKFKPAP